MDTDIVYGKLAFDSRNLRVFDFHDPFIVLEFKYPVKDDRFFRDFFYRNNEVIESLSLRWRKNSKYVRAIDSFLNGRFI